MTHSTCDLVIAYYKENLDWLAAYKDRPFRKIFLYTKGAEHPASPLPYIEKKLPNIGRCDHTYLHHIVEEYDDLPTVTIFATGSAHAIAHKKQNLDFIVQKAFSTHDTVFRGQRHKSIKDTFHDFKLNSWQATNSNNKEDASKDTLHPARIRPFKQWYEKTFPGIDVDFVTFGGVFAVSKPHIHNRKKESYMRLMRQFPKHSNPELGHYFERAWLAVFHPVPEKCLYPESEHFPSGGGGVRKRGKTRRAPTRKRQTRRRRRSSSRSFL
jgi:hypothetical protein